MELAIRRFDFGELQDFRIPAAPPEIVTDHTLPEAEEYTPPPPPSFSQEELEAAKLAAHEEGRQAGIAEERAAQENEAKAREQDILRTMNSIVEQATEMRGNLHTFKASQTKEISALVQLLVAKIAGDALREHPAAGVERMIDDCLGVLQQEPKIIAQVNPDIFEVIEEKFRDIAEQHHLENTITIKANPSLGRSEAILDWMSGSAQRDMESLLTQIEGMISTMDFSKLAGEAPANAISTSDDISEDLGADDNNEQPEQQGEVNE